MHWFTSFLLLVNVYSLPDQLTLQSLNLHSHMRWGFCEKLPSVIQRLHWRSIVVFSICPKLSAALFSAAETTSNLTSAWKNKLRSLFQIQHPPIKISVSHSRPPHLVFLVLQLNLLISLNHASWQFPVRFRSPTRIRSQHRTEASLFLAWTWTHPAKKWGPGAFADPPPPRHQLPKQTPLRAPQSTARQNGCSTCSFRPPAATLMDNRIPPFLSECVFKHLHKLIPTPQLLLLKLTLTRENHVLQFHQHPLGAGCKRERFSEEFLLKSPLMCISFVVDPWNFIHDNSGGGWLF